MEIDLLTATVFDTELKKINTGAAAFSPSSYTYVTTDRTIVYQGVQTSDEVGARLTAWPRGVGLTARIRNISVREVFYDQAGAPLTLFNHPANTPRIEYNAAGERLGLLVEEARTNLVASSENIGGTGWATLTTNVTKTDGIAWSGITPSLLTNNAGAGVVGAIIFNFTANAAPYTQTLILERGTSLARTNFGIYQGGWVGLVAYNWDTKLIENGAGTIDSSSVEQLGIGPNGGDLVRLSMTSTPAAGTAGFYFYFYGSGGGSVQADSSLYFYTAQLEAGAFPTSYIPTSGATATRAADVASTSLAGIWEDTAGTVVMEVSLLSNVRSCDLPRFWDGSLNNVIGYYTNGTPTVSNAVLFIKSGNVLQPVTTSGQVDLEQTTKFAFAYGRGVFSHCRGGGAASNDAFTEPTGINSAYFGAQGAIANTFCGHIKSLQYIPRRLTNAQLQELTQ